MPSLTHVCMFYKHSWKRVTPEEAAEIFPETVSAHGGLFMCELCGQYVSLTKEGKKIRHFRHRSREADKSCPEPATAPGNPGKPGCSWPCPPRLSSEPPACPTGRTNL